MYSTLPSLRSIRVLRLHPGSEEDLVTCSLEVVEDYHSPPPYNALSYCWGDPTDVIELSCDGIPFKVTRNLDSALRRLRQRDHSDLIWADAICINQSDIPERNHQVTVMNEIYSRASCVFVWIGPKTKRTSEVIEMAQIIAHRIHQGWNTDDTFDLWLSGLRMGDQTQTMKIIEVYPLRRADFPDEKWASFWKFYHESQWFFRVWVIQEVQQNSKVSVICENDEVSWDTMSLAATWAWLGSFLEIGTVWIGLFPSRSGFLHAAMM